MRVAWLLVLLQAGCLNINRSFECSGDSDCRSSAGDGVCITRSSRCAFNDSACDSGLRFGELADELSGTCVGSTTPPGDGGPSVAFQSVSAGEDHTCAVTTDNKLYCWGDNLSGQLGIGEDETQALSPALVPLDDVRAVRTGASHTCALVGQDDDTRRRVFCWGDNSQGQLGIASSEGSSFSPQQVLNDNGLSLEDTTLLDVGDNHGCAVDDGELYCWGSNEFGNCGIPIQDGDIIERDAILVTGQEAGDVIVSVALGARHSCVLVRNGGMYTARCFGDNRDLQAGVQPTGILETMTTTLFSFSQGAGSRELLSAGGEVSCAVNDSTESMQCWGSNEASQFGTDIGAENTEIPVQVPLFDSPRQIAVGGEHSCAALLSGVVSCWGLNIFGQTGVDGGGTIVSMPTALSLVVDAGDTLSAGANHTCGIVNGGNVRCWGDNAFGQLGTGDQMQRNSPTDIDL